jgi:predicted transcriptional regulator
MIELTTEIVSAYVGNNTVAINDLAGLIRDVYNALGGTTTPSLALAPAPAPIEVKMPAASIKRSVREDYLICLEDGLKFKTLKRHLRAKFNMSPEAYRAKWGLPANYPMVAPAYAAARSNLAKQIGLGQGGRRPAAKPRRAKKV